MYPITVESLPTSGFANYPFKVVELLPLSFIDIIDYLRTYPSGGSEYDIFMYRYRLSKRKIKEIDLLYLPDIYYLWYVLFSVSINDNLNIDINYNCPSCGTKNKCSVSHSEVKYKRFDRVDFDFTFSNGRRIKFKFPTGAQIEKNIAKYSVPKYGFNIPLDVALMIISCELYEKNPLEAENLVLGATGEDAMIMFGVKELMTDVIQDYQHQCKNCGDINLLDLGSILSNDFFRLFVENTRPAKIQDSP